MGQMTFHESLPGRIAVNGVQQVIGTLARSGMKHGLILCKWVTILCVFGVVIAMVGVLVRQAGNPAIQWNRLAALVGGFFCIGWCLGVLANLAGRELFLLGERGIGLWESGSERKHWPAEEIASVEIIDGPNNRIIFEIEFVDIEKHPPLQFITKCRTEQRADMERGLEALAAARARDTQTSDIGKSAWCTEESDQRAVITYFFFRATLVGGSIAAGLLAALFVAIAVLSGKPLLLAGAAAPFLILLMASRVRPIVNGRLRTQYEEAMARRKSKKNT